MNWVSAVHQEEVWGETEQHKSFTQHTLDTAHVLYTTSTTKHLCEGSAVSSHSGNHYVNHCISHFNLTRVPRSSVPWNLLKSQ